MSHERYENPLITRYASSAMAQIWSDQRKHSTWRRLWIALAEAEQELGLEISDEPVGGDAGVCRQIDFEVAQRYERRCGTM